MEPVQPVVPPRRQRYFSRPAQEVFARRSKSGDVREPGPQFSDFSAFTLWKDLLREESVNNVARRGGHNRPQFPIERSVERRDTPRGESGLDRTFQRVAGRLSHATVFALQIQKLVDTLKYTFPFDQQ